MNSYIGELASLGTVFCWVICALAFESAGKKIGSMPVNLIRLIFALILISIYTYFSRGYFFPVDATPKAWLWLSISGVVGFFIGDLCLFRAFVLIGSRISLLIYSLAPPISAVIGLVVFNEHMTFWAIFGMIITIAGISLVILKKNSKKIVLNHPVEGVILAVLGALGQAFGIGLSKLGMQITEDQFYDPFASTQIRIISASICFLLLFTFLGKWRELFNSFNNRRAITQVAVGSVFGPFIGVSLSLLAVSYTSMGIASTIMAIIPVVAIFPHIIIYKVKIEIREILGTILAVVGVAFLFI